jgi:acetyltransferase
VSPQVLGVCDRAGNFSKCSASALSRFRRLLVEQPWIDESDINPLLASPERFLALDARVVLQPLEMKPEELPRPAARTYPAQYVSHFTMKNGASVLIRPIRPEDEPLMVKFHATLSDQTVYLRYFHMEDLSARVAHERLVRKCFIDYHREMALVVEGEEPNTGERELLAIGRITRESGGEGAEVAVLVNDASQKQGLGVELLRRLIEWARDEKLSWILALISPQNAGMNALARQFNFKIRPSDDPGLVKAVLDLYRGGGRAHLRPENRALLETQFD